MTDQELYIKIKVNIILDVYKMLIYTCTFLNTLPELVPKSYNHTHVCTHTLTQPHPSGKAGYQHIHPFWGWGFPYFHVPPVRDEGALGLCILMPLPTGY